MADQGKNDQKFIFAIAMRSAQAGGWPAASSGEGDSGQAPMVRQEREERRRRYPTSSRANGQRGWAPGDAHCSTIDNRASGVYRIHR